MRFRRWCGAGLFVLLCGTIAAARSGPPDNADITVLVYVNARVTPPTLREAELEAARIFRGAGVRVAWINCSGQFGPVAKECKTYATSKQFVLHIVPTGKTSNDSVFGMAFLAEDGSGRYSDVFFDRVELAHRQFGANVPQLLGAVAAHELGHLLLGSHAHSWSGVMAPIWKKEAMRDLEMGTLFFTGDQSSLMRERIRKDDVELAGSGEMPGHRAPTSVFARVP